MKRVKKRWGRRVVMLGTSAAVVAGSALVALPATSHADPNCAPYMAYIVPGTTETTIDADPAEPKGLLKPVGEKIKERLGDKVKVQYVPYSASAFDKGMTYAASERSGVRALAEMMAQCPDSDSVIAGYSQGAQVAGDVAWHIGNFNKPVWAERVKGVGLLADPLSGQQATVGVARSGSGIAGGRPGGYGSLGNRIKWVCDEKDLYCNVSSANPFIKTIGTMISTGGTGTPPPLDGAGSKDPLQDLTSDFSNVDLPGAKSKATDLKTRTQALAESGSTPTESQVRQVGDLAKDLSDTYGQTGKAVDFANESGAADSLREAKTGTPSAQTVPVLDAVDKTDMGALTSDTSDIAAAADGLLSGGDGDLSGSADVFKDMALKGAAVAQNSGLLNDVDHANLSAATSVLGTLNFGTIIDTSLQALTTALSTDYQGIVDRFNQLGAQLAAMDAKAAHKTAGEINTMLEPWVDLADSANADVMPMAAAVVGAVPDPQGYTQIASMVMKLMSQVDIKALAETVGQAQEVAWGVVEGHPEKAVELVPIGLNLGLIGLGALTGQGSSGSTGNDATIGADSSGLGGAASLASLVGEVGAPMDLAQLVTDGISFASFLSSSAHTSAYTNKAMVGGRSGVDYLGEYLVQRLEDTGDAGSSNRAGEASPEESDSDSSPEESDSDSGNAGQVDTRSGREARESRESAARPSSSPERGSNGNNESPAPSGEPHPRSGIRPVSSNGTALRDFDSVTTAQPVGLAVAAPGVAPVTAGDQTVRPAWSTSKVPVALAAERKQGSLPAAAAPAIKASDNDSAQAMWDSLGGGQSSATAVTDVLRSGGDTKSKVPAERTRSEYTAFGQTQWSLADTAAFAAGLACLPDGGGVLGLMSQVDANQQWGAWKVSGLSPAVKGGWGPDESGNYTVRQIGVLTKSNGEKVGVALSTHAPGGTLDSGITALNQAGDWLSQNVDSLPSGKCG